MLIGDELLAGPAQCLDCGEEWPAMWPTGAEALQCPACDSIDTVRDAEGEIIFRHPRAVH